MKYIGPKIGSIESLANTLSISKTSLDYIISNIQFQYKTFLIESKNGKIRQICEPKIELKNIQKRINSRILSKVQYPHYLQGGIKDPQFPRDSFNNANIHIDAKWVINMDIKNFYQNIKFRHVEQIFKHHLNFHPSVSAYLARLVTYEDIENGDLYIPQGAVTSSYIANLVFFSDESSLVNSLKSQNIRYTRLLDDITLSSSQYNLSPEQEIKLIKKISTFIKVNKFSINKKKTTVIRKNHPLTKMQVTGLVINTSSNSKIPKCPSDVVSSTRKEVMQCIKEYKFHNNTKYRHTYHQQWNTASGKVARLERSSHHIAKSLRENLRNCLPQYDASTINHIGIQVDYVYSKYLKNCKVCLEDNNFVYKVNYLIYQCSVIARSNIKYSTYLRSILSRIPVQKKIPN